MKSIKTLFLIFIILIIVVIAYTLVQKNRTSPEKPFALYSIMDTEKPGKVHKIEIKTEDTVCLFEKREKEWQLVAPIQDIIDTTAFNNVLRGIQNLELKEIISNRPERHPDFEVTDKDITIKVITQRDSISFILGKQAPDFLHWYFRFSNMSEVYLSKGLSRYIVNKTPDEWRGHSAMSFEAEDL